LLRCTWSATGLLGPAKVCSVGRSASTQHRLL